MPSSVARNSTIELSVNVRSSDVFLFPSKSSRRSSTDSSSEPAAPEYSEVDDQSVFSKTSSKDDQAVLYAYCELKIPAKAASSSDSRIPNRLKNLTLSLISHESISFPKGGMEANRTYENEKIIQEALDMPYFEPGKTYRFERIFFIDHNSAPFQRSNWGINNQKVVAKATFNGLLTKSLAVSKKVYFVDCQNDEGNEMIVFEKDVRIDADNIGPFSLRNRSEVFTVGGYLRTSFDLLCPLEGVKIVGFRGYIEQRTTLTSRRERPGYVETLRPKKTLFVELTREQVEEEFEKKLLAGGGEGVGPEGPYPALDLITRLPDDNKIRPSSVAGNDAAIRFRTFIDYEIDFIDGEPRTDDSPSTMIYVDNQKMKRFHVSIPVFLNSCGCRPDSFTLPTYTCKDPMPEQELKAKAAQHSQQHDKEADPTAAPCMCNFSLESLLEVESKSLAAAAQYHGEAPRHSMGSVLEVNPPPSYKCTMEALRDVAIPSVQACV